MKVVTYKNYAVTKFDSGKIEVAKNNNVASPTKPLLRELAKELNISIKDKNGNLLNTRQLGTSIIRAIENKEKYEHSEAQNSPKQSNLKINQISFMNAIRNIVSTSPQTPQEIRDKIERIYPYLYGTETHYRNVEKGHYTDIPHAVLAQIYSQTKNNNDFLIDKSTKPLTIGLNKDTVASSTSFQAQIDQYLSRNKCGTFYLNKGEKLENVLTQNNVPNQYGVYIIYSIKKDQENLIYIGKAGSMITNGEFKKQGINNRLKAVGTNNIPRNILFQNVIKELEIDKLKFLWFVTFDESNHEIPAYAEAKLIQLYYEEYHKLPLLNKSI